MEEEEREKIPLICETVKAYVIDPLVAAAQIEKKKKKIWGKYNFWQ